MAALAPVSPGTYGSSEDITAAAAELACAMLDVEYRVLVPHMQLLLHLAWSAATEDGGSSSGGVAAASACEVIVQLIEAHAELRQLDVLFTVMFTALPGLQGSGAHDSARGDATAAAAAASHLLGSPAVLAAVASAVAAAPKGQAPALVACVAGCLRTLLASCAAPMAGQAAQSHSDVAELDLARLAAPLAAVLDALPVDLTTAAGVAAAAEGVVGCLAGAGSHALLAAAGGGSDRVGVLALVLLVYASAVRCEPVHPNPAEPCCCWCREPSGRSH